ncbi:MAG: dihydrofolate reductase [Verrucomicrobiota bacterium]|nr:dihydrofolate reductase [Verrucomicrobiota bacterium]
MKSGVWICLLFAWTMIEGEGSDQSFEIKADRFADIQVLRYRAPGFDQLTLQQKKLAYYLAEAGLSGRDIFYDQRYKHNLRVRKTLEGILKSYEGNRQSPDFEKFLVYARRVFFANGIHHHYSNTKMLPDFSREYFRELLEKSDLSKLPLAGKPIEDFRALIEPVIFDPKVAAKVVDLSADVDNVTASASNFYEGVTEQEVEAYYEALRKKSGNPRLSHGLNSKVVKENGEVREKVWKVGGMYSAAIERIVFWLEKAVTVAETEEQRDSLRHLIEYYKTGDLQKFDEHCIAWVKDTKSRIDAVNGFIEVYQDPMQKKGSFESVVSLRDEEASRRIDTISQSAQWFEDHSPIKPEHKKKNVVGISAKVITVVSEVGDSAPATPVGINLPNAEWIREQHGSKSVTIGNIMAAYNEVRSRSPMIDEFGATPEIIERVKKHGALARTLHVDMHEVIGHASGQINPGVGNTDKTLKGYAGTLEEARADLVALYYALDPKLLEIGVMPSMEVGKADYDSYILEGLMTQLYRVEPGHDLEEAHMRNRQLVSAWAYEKGLGERVIERSQREGKTYFKVNDYEKLRKIFGELLREIQRIKSEGDYEAGKNLVETYGVKVDQELLKEVHLRYKPLNIAPYMGFIQPRLVPVTNEQTGEIREIKIEYPTDFIGQMLEYADKYSYLPIEN